MLSIPKFCAVLLMAGMAAVPAFTQNVSAPVLNPPTGTYNAGQMVSLTAPTSGTSIRYTTDGSTPSTSAGILYTTPVAVNVTTTIKALAFRAGSAKSAVVSATYTIQLPNVSAPVFSPAGGTYSSAQAVILNSATSSATIRFTLDGTEPGPDYGILYSSAVQITAGTTLKAIAFKSGMLNSQVASAEYILKCATPVFSPPAATFERPQAVALTCPTPASSIRYTTDGSVPSELNGTVYTGPVMVNVSSSIQACAYKTGYVASEISGGLYTVGNKDSDGDGVIDAEDDYPQDPLRALNNFFPASGNGSLAFEDLWPAQGDYDLNDVVVDYFFKTVSTGAGKLVETYATFILRASGATLKNGFGFQFSGTAIPSTGITVTGMKLTKGYISLNTNGTEAGQSIPTFIVFDNAYDLLKHPGSGTGINTTSDAPYAGVVIIELHIVYTANTYRDEQLDIEHFNPFIIVNMARDREVHLPDYPPTSLAAGFLFGTGDDTSVPSLNRYYRTGNNLPWALNIYESFDYPMEKAGILKTYLHFAEWAQSSGRLYPDWYRFLPGYRDEINIYRH